MESVITQALARYKSCKSIKAHRTSTSLLRTRGTHIICTIGPASNNVETLVKLLDEGMSVMRLNFSHGSYEYHKSTIDTLRKALEMRPGQICAIALDTKGPEIRTGLLTDHKEVVIDAGSNVFLSIDDSHRDCGTAELLYVDYKDLPSTVNVGSSIFIDDGLLNLRVVSIEGNGVKCQAVNKASIGERKGVNLPGALVTLPAVSEKDKADLLFGLEQGVDVIFASFIRKASQVLEVKNVLGNEGQHIKIYSKIENQEGLDNFDEILAVSDGIMVARGDLGIEIPFEKVFSAQKQIIRKCNLAGKPVICATQMLESMISNPRPTRAEISDVGNAVVDGADCIMLSGETAKGKYPVESVQTMHRVALEAETQINHRHIWNTIKDNTKTHNNAEELAAAAAGMTFGDEFQMIVVITETGDTLRLISKYRPPVPIVALTNNPIVARQCVLHRGVNPVLLDSLCDIESLINLSCAAGKEHKWCESGSKVIVLYRTSVGHNTSGSGEISPVQRLQRAASVVGKGVFNAPSTLQIITVP